MPKDNQPLQSVANAYRAKMFRAINGRKYHVKLARIFLKQKPPNLQKFQLHRDVAIKFNELADYNQARSTEIGDKVIKNQNSENTIYKKVSD